MLLDIIELKLLLGTYKYFTTTDTADGIRGSHE